MNARTKAVSLFLTTYILGVATGLALPKLESLGTKGEVIQATVVALAALLGSIYLSMIRPDKTSI